MKKQLREGSFSGLSFISVGDVEQNASMDMQAKPFQSLSTLTGVQIINYIRVETPGTVKAVNTKESSDSKNSSFSILRAKV